uniref:Ubiquitinyl hydrolase 1 n=1 Tax=Oreochromis aureus TaxID=47969 RepID=A0A668W7M5_OREAU
MKMEDGSLISCREDISSLFPAQMLSAKQQDLSSQFSSVRKVCGDGNCFYRAFCFAYLESVLHSARDLQRFKDKIIQGSAILVSAGFEEDFFRHHLDTVLHVVDQCQADVNALFRLFNEHATSDRVVQYLRLLTSAHLRNNADFFRNFVEAPDLHVYCHQWRLWRWSVIMWTSWLCPRLWTSPSTSSLWKVMNNSWLTTSFQKMGTHPCISSTTHLITIFSTLGHNYDQQNSARLRNIDSG